MNYQAASCRARTRARSAASRCWALLTGCGPSEGASPACKCPNGSSSSSTPASSARETLASAAAWSSAQGALQDRRSSQRNLRTKRACLEIALDGSHICAAQTGPSMARLWTGCFPWIKIRLNAYAPPGGGTGGHVRASRTGLRDIHAPHCTQKMSGSPCTVASLRICPRTANGSDMQSARPRHRSL